MIGGFHDLEAALESFIDPARNVLKSARSEASAFMKATIDWDRIIVLEPFNNHIEHDGS
jgi:hypothetical protein